MELTFAQQSAAFLYAIILGAFLGIVYGVFKFARFAFFSSKPAVIIMDILFMLISSLAIFFFSLAYLSGYLRIYVFAGAALGFVLYRITLGRLLFLLYSPVIKFMRKIFCKICTKIKKISKIVLKFAHKLLYNIHKKKDFLNRKKKEDRSADEHFKTKNPKGKARGGGKAKSRKRSAGIGKA